MSRPAPNRDVLLSGSAKHQPYLWAGEQNSKIFTLRMNIVSSLMRYLYYNKKARTNRDVLLSGSAKHRPRLWAGEQNSKISTLRVNIVSQSPGGHKRSGTGKFCCTAAPRSGMSGKGIPRAVAPPLPPASRKTRQSARLCQQAICVCEMNTVKCITWQMEMQVS